MQGRLTGPETALIANAIPGFGAMVEQGRLFECLEILEVGEHERLSADGMYIVLEGEIDLLLNGHRIATAGKSDYFYEEHLILDDIAAELVAESASPARLVKLARSAWSGLVDELKQGCQQLLFGDLVNIHLHEFQQPINCCNITAAALSITSLGFACDVNDIFQSCSLPVSYVVDDGMTVGELYDVASTYVFAKGLRDQIGVELYFFDRAIMTRDDLYHAIAESDRVGGDSDILVANFGVGIAHGKPEMGGGHFALIAKCNQSTGLVHMMDVHPAKYGKIWVTSIDRLYEAMSDYDSSSRRSRGLMRFIVKEAIDVRLDTLSKSDCFPINCTRYFDLTPEKRRHIFTRSSTNLNSLHVLSMALGILDSDPVEVDEILEAANISYTDALSIERTSAQLAEVAGNYLASLDYTDIRCSAHSFDDADATRKEAWFKTQLLSIAGNPKAYFLININYNEVVGYEAIHDVPSQYLETPLFKEFWCVCVDYEYENDIVVLADMSPATSQIWRAPRAKVFRGLRETHSPAVLYLEKVEAVRDAWDFNHLISTHPLLLFHHAGDSECARLRTVLANIGADALHTVDINGPDAHARALRKKLAQHSGFDAKAYLYFDGNCLGNTGQVIEQVRRGELQNALAERGLPVLPRQETPSLDANIFSYPKGGLTAPYDGKQSILVCTCGSPAAAQVPALVSQLKSAGHKVRLLPTPSSETFFKDIGMERLLRHLRPGDIYRDEDEWKFEYIEETMQLRPVHVALCDWADCIVVAPMTANTLAKAAHGVTDNLLTSVLAAWDYSKPAIFCPAAYAGMWESQVTQNNVRILQNRGARIEGPREMMLANGSRAAGIMSTVDAIVAALEDASATMFDPRQTVLRWASDAALSNDSKKWERIFRALDNHDIDINVVDAASGDSLLHLAAGGAGQVTATGIHRGIPNAFAIDVLLSRNIDVNLTNNYGFGALEVAAMNDSVATVEALLQAGANPSRAIELINQGIVPETTAQVIATFARQQGRQSVS